MNPPNKKAYDIAYFDQHFCFMKKSGEWVCYGTINNYDYSFSSSSQANARTMAIEYLKRYGHLK